MEKPDVVAFGSAVMDFIVNIDKAPKTNQSVQSTSMSWQYGGKVATGIVAAKMLSGRPCGISSTYSGPIGALIKKDFERHGIDVSQMVEYDYGSSKLTLVIAIKEDQSRNFYTMPQTIPRLQEEDIDEAYIAQAKYLYLHEARAGSQRAAQLARKNNVKIVFDADEYYPEGMPEILKQVDYLIPSEFCYNTMFPDGGDIEQNLYKIREMAAPGAVVIVTLGEKGLVGLDEVGFFSMPAFKVDAVDTTGAGDVFHGAFIAGLLRNMTVREAARYASGASAIKCTRIGGRAGIPSHEVLMRFLETGEIDYTEIDKRVDYYSKMPTV